MADFLQTPSPSAELRAIKWFTFTHAVGLALFVLLMGSFFWYLQRLETQQQQQRLYRDIEWAQQSMRLKWRENQDPVMSMAPEWARVPDAAAPGAQALRDFLVRNPDIVYVAALDAQRRTRWVLPSPSRGAIRSRTAGDVVEDSAGYAAFADARTETRPVFSPPFLAEDNEVWVEMHAPVVTERTFRGTIAVGYSLDRALVYTLPREAREHYQVAIVDQGGNLMVSSSPRAIHQFNMSYELPLDPPGHGVRLRAFSFEDRPRLLDRTLLAAVAGLALASVVSLSLLWRHARRRVEAESERDRLFTLSLDVMAVMRTDGTFVRVNPAFGERFGVLPAERRLTDLAHSDDRPVVASALAALAEAATGSTAAEFEARFAHGDAWRWLRWSVRTDPDRHGRALYAVAHDITVRKNTETALAAETAFRRAMEDSMLTGMRVFDMDGRIKYVNRAFCQMVGYSEEELIGATAPFPYWLEGDRDKHFAELRSVLEGRSPTSGFQITVQRKDGTVFDARMYISPLVDAAGHQTGWMTSVTDITEPMRIRAELAAAHERFTTVLDELDAAVSVVPWPTDRQRATGPELLFANRFYRRMFGATGVAHGSLLARRSGRRNAASFEAYDPKVGRWFEVRSRQIRWVDGNPAQMLVATDVTRRREAEELQRQQDEKLQRTARLVTMGEMASSLAHELNQPLTAIANYCMGLSARVRAKLAAGQPVDGAEMLEMLAKTAGQAERAGKVIRRIRDFVKRSEPERRACDIATVLADSVGLAEIDAQRNAVAVHVEVPDPLPGLLADPILIEQVLLNLMKNGIDAMRQCPRRELRVTVTASEQTVEFAVADTGHGISADAHGKLFEPFFTTKTEGMGMGLNICRSIIESHQGRLWVEPRPGGGTVFRFTLPTAERPVVAHAA